MKVILPFALFLLLVGCKKEADQQSRESLIAKSWKMTDRRIINAFDGTGYQGNDQDLFTGDPCFAQKPLTFYRDGTFLHDTAQYCPNDYAFHGTWSFSEDKQWLDLKYISGYRDLHYYVVALTPNEMKIQMIERIRIPTGDSINWVIESDFVAR